MKIVKFTTDLVFEIGEVLVFRGTDGLPFNLLKITENVSRGSIGPRSKLGEIFWLRPRKMKRTFSMP